MRRSGFSTLIAVTLAVTSAACGPGSLARMDGFLDGGLAPGSASVSPDAGGDDAGSKNPGVPDAGAATDGGAVGAVDSGTVDAGTGLKLCVSSKIDLELTGAATLTDQPGGGAARGSLVAGDRVTSLEQGLAGQSCPDGGWYRVQRLTEKGWASGGVLALATCTGGSAFAMDVDAVIRTVFGTYGDAAVRVSHCESGPWGTMAINGQYFGLFQMGSYERQTYGDSSCAEGQSQAANGYFIATGRTWSPWSCKP